MIDARTQPINDEGRAALVAHARLVEETPGTVVMAKRAASAVLALDARLTEAERHAALCQEASVRRGNEIILLEAERDKARAESDARERILLAAAEAADPECPDHAAYVDGQCNLGDVVRGLRTKAKKLQAFKDFVHRRLDEGGVPVDPPGEHRDAGCRVGQRLDWLFDALKAAQQRS